MSRSRVTPDDEYADLERRIAALPEEADIVERRRAANRCYGDVLDGEAERYLTREQRDQLLTLLQSVVEVQGDES
jgi:hypothetical protein